MTKEDARKRAEIMLAYANGAEIEVRMGMNDSWTTLYTPAFEQSNLLEYRIKPEKKYRPWKPEEVPVGAMIHWNSSTKHTYLIYSHYSDEGKVGIFKRDGIKTYEYETLFKYCSWSRDGKTWQPCGVKQ